MYMQLEMFGEYGAWEIKVFILITDLAMDTKVANNATEMSAKINKKIAKHLPHHP